jgi:hypothetical protein
VGARLGGGSAQPSAETRASKNASTVVSVSAAVAETPLDRWLRRQAAREQRVVVLEEGLLGDRLWRYSFYRLRYFFLSYLNESALHAVTVLFLFRHLAWGNFRLVVVATAVSAFVSSFWWGALEALRGQVRDLHRSGKPHRIEPAIAGWLTLALALSGVLLVAGAGWTVWRAIDGRFDVADAFVAVLFLKLALDLPVRCYHSGVYAIRRVYKPLAATLVPEFLGLATILVFWPLVGVWSVVIGSVLTTAVLTGLSLLYTRRVYHFLGFKPIREAGVDRMRESLRGATREFFIAGTSHAVMALDALAVLALLLGARVDSRSLVVLFITMPTIRAGAEWARLLYFDLKRLELRLFTNLRKRFERHTLRLAWLLALVFWVVAAGIATGYYRKDVGGLALALLGFFVARSLLARAQIQAFAEGAYAEVLATGALCLVGFAAVGLFADGETARLVAVGLVAAVCAGSLTRVRRSARTRGEPGTALLTLEWLRRLGNVRTPVRVGSARVVSAGGPERLDARTAEDRNRWRLSQLADRTARRLGPSGAAAWIGPDRLVWFEPAGDSPRVTADWLQPASGGLMAVVEQRDCATGEEALLAAGRGELVGYASQHLLEPVFPVDVDAARRTFEELLPDGVVYSPDEPVPPKLAALPASELRTILVDAVVFARDLRSGRPRSSFDVTALCSGGELRLIFVADPNARRQARGRWRHLVTALNVRGAIGGVRVPAHPARLGRPAFLRA